MFLYPDFGSNSYLNGITYKEEEASVDGEPPHAVNQPGTKTGTGQLH
jgi:hypothetical protein